MHSKAFQHGKPNVNALDLTHGLSCCISLCRGTWTWHLDQTLAAQLTTPSSTQHPPWRLTQLLRSAPHLRLNGHLGRTSCFTSRAGMTRPHKTGLPFPA